MLHKITINGNELSKPAREWWANTDMNAYDDENGNIWIGTSKADAEFFGTIEDVDKAFCAYQEEADAILDEQMQEKLGGPWLIFEISESGMTLDEIIAAVGKKYPGWQFRGTEPMFQSCIVAMFEKM